MSNSDRRKWIKTPRDLNLEYPDQEIDFIDKKYDEYLAKLHLNNRITKLLEEKDEKQKELKQLESGFNLYVNGAHKPTEKLTPKHVVTTAPKITNKRIDMLNIPKIQLRKEDLCEKAKCKTDRPKTERRKWSNSSIIIKTMDGLKIRINAPSKTNRDDYYSDDFESDSSEDEKQTNNSLIKTVKFSDSDSDYDEHYKKSIELSVNELKSLKQSLDMMSLSFESDEIEEEIYKEPVIKTKNFESSEKCDYILKNIVNLKAEERKELLKFLKEIDKEGS